MTGALVEAYRHNAWATKHLLAHCRGLPEEQLAATATGGYGSILATFHHIVHADGRYLDQLSGSHAGWLDHDEKVDLAQLEAWVEETGQGWERFLAEPVDAERVIVLGNGKHEVRAGIIVAQALYHGISHREQICAILTSLGSQPPDLQPWAYAQATGRVWATPAV